MLVLLPIYDACGQALASFRSLFGRFRYFPDLRSSSNHGRRSHDLDLSIYDLTYLFDVVCFRVLRWGTFTHFTVLLRIFDLKSTHSRVVGYTKTEKFTCVCIFCLHPMTTKVSLSGR